MSSEARPKRGAPVVSFKVVIPARYASTRLPGKPLLSIAGRPMLAHVYERALRAGASEVIIATDDARVRDAARGFGARVVMTSAQHRSGTERVAEIIGASGEPDTAIVVNVQGDEPLLPPALVRQVAANLAARPEADVATLCTPIASVQELFDPGVVKVVLDQHGYALYFSRAPIPWHREGFASELREFSATIPWFRHIGLYAYRAGFLLRYVGTPSCALEEAEALEQLRVLWFGGRVHVAAAAERPGPGVDTLEDLERVRALLG